MIPQQNRGAEAVEKPGNEAGADLGDLARRVLQGVTPAQAAFLLHGVSRMRKDSPLATTKTGAMK